MSRPSTSAVPASTGRAPLRLVLPAVAGLVVLLAPLAAMVARTPWATLPERLTDPQILMALRLSVVTATIASVLCLVMGLPLAWVLARTAFRGRSLLRALVTVPLVLPPVVAGVALLSAFGRNGVIGGPLRDWFDLTIPYTTTAVVLAQTFVALPFVVISIEGALRATNRAYDDVAAVLGADRWGIFARVTVPLALPGIAAGLVLGWARALGEFGATITFAGNYPGSTQTMPLAVYTALQSDPEAAVVLSLILLVVSVVVLALLRERWFGQAAR
ncbi:MAG TPA: ABC transporter permease [Nocardioidaceae bacterium]|nr:ABC transporter permease [Nocardioidaceae bacterium]